jgi:hypothetical protein
MRQDAVKTEIYAARGGKKPDPSRQDAVAIRQKPTWHDRFFPHPAVPTAAVCLCCPPFILDLGSAIDPVGAVARHWRGQFSSILNPEF